MRTTHYQSRNVSAYGQKKPAPTKSSFGVPVPKPVQTSSIKAEHGCFDVTALLLPTGSKGGWGASKSKSKGTSDAPGKILSADKDTVSDRSVASTKDSDSSSGSPSQGSLSSTDLEIVSPLVKSEVPIESPPPLDRGSPPVHAMARPWTVEPTGPRVMDMRDYQDEFPSALESLRENKGTSPVEDTSPSSKPVEEQPNRLETLREDTESPDASLIHPITGEETKAKHSMDTPRKEAALPHIFSTPSPDDTTDEAEKERRRRALALEQQEIILRQVQAARESRTQNQKRARKPKKTLKRDIGEGKKPVTGVATAKGTSARGPRSRATVVHTKKKDGRNLGGANTPSRQEPGEGDEAGVRDTRSGDLPKNKARQHRGGRNPSHGGRRPKKHQVAAMV